MSNHHRDLHRLHGLAALAILTAVEAFEKRRPELMADARKNIEEGKASFALFVTSDGINVHTELGLAQPKANFFPDSLLRVDGAIEAATADPKSVSVNDRSKAN